MLALLVRSCPDLSLLDLRAHKSRRGNIGIPFLLGEAADPRGRHMPGCPRPAYLHPSTWPPHVYPSLKAPPKYLNPSGWPLHAPLLRKALRFVLFSLFQSRRRGKVWVLGLIQEWVSWSWMIRGIGCIEVCSCIGPRWYEAQGVSLLTSRGPFILAVWVK